MTYKELETYLTQKGVSKMDFCRETGISPQILTNAKLRGGHFSASTMNKMESFLNKDKITNDSLSDIEKNIVETFRKLDAEGQKEMSVILAYLEERSNKR